MPVIMKIIKGTQHFKTQHRGANCRENVWCVENEPLAVTNFEGILILKGTVCMVRLDWIESGIVG